VHADETALISALIAIEEAGIERIWCLGDWCSGGMEPRQCFDIICERCEVILLGNHEMFVLLHIWRDTQGGWAGSARFAREEIGDARYARLRDFSCHAVVPSAELVHGSLLNPCEDFLLGERSAQRNLELLDRPLLLFGHTHAPALWEPSKGGRWAREVDITVDEPYELPEDISHPDAKRLLNPGAVCDNRGARWLELELGERRVATWHQTDTPGHGGMFSHQPPRPKRH
jgi:predicted phosphodiesterase